MSYDLILYYFLSFKTADFRHIRRDAETWMSVLMFDILCLHVHSMQVPMQGV